MATTPTASINRSLGALESRMDSTEERLKRMEDKLDTLVETMASSRGGLKTLLAISGFVAAATAVISQLLHWLAKPG